MRYSLTSSNKNNRFVVAHRNECDLIIANALVVDGSGSAATEKDVAIDKDLIVGVGELDGWMAEQRIDASGLVLSPGFIDVHTHDDLEVIKNPAMACKVSQGVTSVVAGNCGVSISPVYRSERMPAPFPLLGKPEEFSFPKISDYRNAFERAQPAVNLALLIGHSSLRLNVMKDALNRPATDQEISLMSEILQRGLEDGCIGLSSGLDYPPAFAAPKSEMITLVRVLKDYPSAIYTTHMRDESDGVVDAVQETIETGREADVPVVISHHKCAGPRNYGRSTETLDLIKTAQQTHLVTLDVYPYTASSTSLLPRFIRNAEKILIAYSDPYPELACQTLHEVADQWGCDLNEAAERLYPAGAIYFQMDEDDLRRIIAFPPTMVGSDGLPTMAHPHPRLWGTFPRMLARYVRDQKLLSLEQAIHKMTGLSAKTFNLAKRGLVRKGYYADLVLFDPKTIRDTATYEHPEQPAQGISKVLVNGTVVWADSASTGQRSGVFLSR